MDLDELLQFDCSDPVQRLADDLVKADDRLLQELIDLRKKTMTQQDVANRLGISRPAVAAFERYDADPRLSTVRRYALAIRAHVEHTVIPHSKRAEPQLENLFELWLVASNRSHDRGHDHGRVEHRGTGRDYHSAMIKLLTNK